MQSAEEGVEAVTATLLGRLDTLPVAEHVGVFEEVLTAWRRRRRSGGTRRGPAPVTV